MGVTDDTAATWRGIPLPAEPTDGTLELDPIDVRTAVLTYTRAPGEIVGMWVTRDRGEQLFLTPDGRGVWVVGFGDGGTVFWELDGTAWRRRMAAEVQFYDFAPKLLNGGLWLVVRGGKLFYLKDGAFTAGPEIEEARAGEVLGDDSVIVNAGPDFDLYVGVGTGMDRSWIRIVQ